MMREKHRHLLVESMGEITEDEKTFFYGLSKELVRCIGEMNYDRVNPKFVKLVDKRHFILRSSLEGIDSLIVALAMIKRVNNAETAFYTLKSSGTIRALMKESKEK